MTVSGSIDFSVSRNDIIKASLRVLGKLHPGEVPSAEEINDASQALNMMVKAWQNRGIGLWLNQNTTLALAYATQYYDLGATGTHFSATMNETAIATAAVAGAGTITVDSDDAITNGDYIGIELDDGTMQWTTVNGVPVANVVTLTAVLTDAAAVDNVVFSYTTKAQRPLDILDIRRRNTNGQDSEILRISRSEYMQIANKSTTGKATIAFYDAQMNNGRLYLWPTCNDVSDRILMTIKRTVYDFDAIADTPDFPQEWFRTLKFNLAVEMAPEFNVGGEQLGLIKTMADQSFLDAYNFDNGMDSVYFAPDRRR
jgi:hypothetical protein